MNERFVVLGVAGSRAAWFTEVAQWAHAGSLPVEFIKCVSMEQLHGRLRSGRTFSAAIIDGSALGLDRDAVHRVQTLGVAVFVVDGQRDASHWRVLGADAVLADSFGPQQLVDALRAHAALVPTTELRGAEPAGEGPVEQGRLIAVCGAGGTGTSTIAAVVAQQLATKGLSVVLADLCRCAEQGVLHDAGDVGPSIQELVDACRTSAPTVEQVRAHSYGIPERGYALLLGLRRSSAWTTLRPRAVATAVAGLRAAFDVVVCDCDADVEGHDNGGSWDVEERNALARAATSAADVVVAVGAPGLKGVYSLGRVISELTDSRVAPSRLVPVVNRAGRGSRANRRIADALRATLAGPVAEAARPCVFVPERDIEDALRDRRRLPAALGEGVVAAVERAYLAATPSTDRRESDQARRVVPGDLAAWPEEVPAP